MRRDGEPGKAWRRRSDSCAPGLDADSMFRELQQRELRDITVCQRVWEAENDPLAVVVAVAKCEALPEWLRHAVLVLLTEGESYPALKHKLWRERTRDAVDGTRAAEVARLRAHPNLPQTWEMATVLADHLVRKKFRDTSAAGAASFRRSYDRVRRRLQQSEGRYYRAPGITEALSQAWTYQLDLMKVQIARARELLTRRSRK